MCHHIADGADGADDFVAGHERVRRDLPIVVEHVATIVLLVLFGWLTGLGWLFWAAAAFTTMLLIYEQSLVKPDDLSRVNLAFFTLNGVVSLTLGIATVADVLLLG